jgi:hypothetical protein
MAYAAAVRSKLVNLEAAKPRAQRIGEHGAFAQP